MANVTLGDLMNPLTKIEKISQETLDAVYTLSDFVVERMVVGQGIQNQLLLESQLQTRLLTDIESNTAQTLFQTIKNVAFGVFAWRRNSRMEGYAKSQVSLLTKIAAKPAGGTGTGQTTNTGGGKVSRDGAKALKDLGMGALLTGNAMLIWTIVPQKAVNKFLDFVTKSFQKFQMFNTKKVKKGISVLNYMGNAIVRFAKSLALATPLILIGAIGLPILIPSLFIMSGIFSLLGGKNFSKRVKRAAIAIGIMGPSLLKFSIGLAAAALASKIILAKPILLLIMSASLLLIGGTVALLGGKQMAKRIRRGGVSLGILGLGLIAFGIGYGIFASTFPSVGIKDILIQSAAILGIGIATALVGKFGVLNILAGALALSVNGLALLVFNLGYIPFRLATKGLKPSDIFIQSGILLAIGGVMALAGVAVAATGGAALLGPLFFAAAGASLLLLTPGLKAMKNLAYSEQDSKDLAITLGAVAMAFSGGSPDSGPLATIGGMFRRVVESGVGLGAAAMYGVAGKALTDLSKGLADFKALGFTEEDSKELAIALTAVSSSFAQAGGASTNPGGLFGLVFGTVFTPTDTEKGIKSVMGAGKALNSVVQGLASFIDLKNKYGLTSESFAPGGFLNVAISETLGFVQSAFAAIGSEGNVDAGGFWGSVFNIKKNVVQEGIDSVSGAGKALSGIVEGLASFIDLKNNYGLTPESFQPGGFLNVAITQTLGFVRSAFAAVGGEENVAAGGFFGSVFNIKKNKVQEGIDSVKGAGEELMNIATGLETFQKLIDKKVVWGKLGMAIRRSLTFVGDAFASIGGKEESDSAFFGLIKWDENLVQKGIKAVKGAGAALTDIAEGLSSFADLSNPTALVTSISGLFKGISTVFAETYENDPRFSSHIGDFRRLINDMGKRAADGDLEKAAADMQSMADAINSVDLVKAEAFGALFKGAADITDNGGRVALRALTDAVEEIRDLMSVSATAATETAVIPSGLVATADAETDQSGADVNILLKQINSTLSSLNSTMSNLPGNIAAIEIKLPND